MKLTDYQKQECKRIALEAISADERGDHVTRDKRVSELFVIAGYWKESKVVSVSEFRGERIPPKMLKMPQGKSVTWPNRWKAVLAWASL